MDQKKDLCDSHAQVLDFYKWTRSLPTAPNSDRLAVARRIEFELISILGHRTPGNIDAFFLDKIGDALVAQWFAGIFFCNHFGDLLFDTPGRNIIAAIVSTQAVVEEIFEFENPVGRLYIFAIADPTVRTE